MTYLTNDDVTIQHVLNGSETGYPYANQQFINYFWGLVVSSLYRLTNVVEWWYFLEILFMLLGCTLFGYSILKTCKKKYLAILIFILSGMSIFIFNFSHASFTVSPCIAITGISCIILTSDEEKWNWKKIVFTGIPVLILALFRHETGNAMLCYYFGSMVYYVFKMDKKESKKNIIRLILTALILFLTFWGIERISESVKEGFYPEGFEEYDSARSEFMDYFGYDNKDAPEIYEKYGWDENLTELVGDWCFLDERFNPDTINAIMDDFSNLEEAVDSDKDSITEILQGTFDELLFGEEYCIVFTGLLGLIILGIIMIVLTGNWKNYNTLFYLAFVVGSAALLSYLFLQNRFILRAYMVVMIPYFSLETILFVKIVSKGNNNAKRAIGIIILALFASVSIYGLSLNFNKETVNNTKAQLDDIKTYNEYMAAHEDNFYLFDISAGDNISPWIETGNNSSLWGSSSFKSDLYYIMLERNGLTELNLDTFNNNNVFFITRHGENNELPRSVELLNNAINRNSKATPVLVESISDTNDVYRFVYDESGKTH